ncbi:hypothetical protein RclHR1_09970003 [Rhizophagus clarus]|uniref:Uncharacterized protein n=1 Tax=Rhizophagus clarus TaxID=94130 RepID=A0A2Z6SBV4_9GLOM|nr:hypothetical protein RclHR1_09970003 [Rhizophagus clarus]
MRLWTSFQKSRVLFEADQVWNSISRSETPLETDYGISKVQNLEADWYFEGPEFRGGLVFRRSRTLVRSRPRYFKRLELKAD